MNDVKRDSSSVKSKERDDVEHAHDKGEMPCSTIRAWFLGFIMAILIPGLNQFFFFRYPSVLISGLVAQLLAYPVGRGMAKVLPDIKIFGARLNPGPFTIKEHVLATIMGTVGNQSAYATDIVAVQRVLYNQEWNFSYQWLLVMSTQLIGFSMGGINRRFLVSPPSMIWPSALVNCALFNTLHSGNLASASNRGGLSRERFFVYVLIGSFCWYFFPGYIFQALSYFAWPCWIAPDNHTVNTLFGQSSGLGMSLLTFDWAQIAYIGSPLVTPWWAEANIFAGFVFFTWIITPALYFTNTWFSQFMPISTGGSFDNTGSKYEVARILTEQNTFDLEKYRAYSPLYLSTTFALSYGLSFAASTAIIVHAILFFRKQIWTQARRALSDQQDIHARLMGRYREVPDWWYACIFLTMFAFGIIVVQVWPTGFPVWAFILSLLIPFVYMVPIGMVQAITNSQVGLNVITEFIIGYMLPGRPVAMMMFKTWGYITMAQGLALTQDFKIGHYMKIPPRSMFFAQVVASIVSLTAQLGVQAWMFTNIEGMCTDPDQPASFTCPSTSVFGTASIIWGVIGPARMFGSGSLYHPLLYFFLIGAVAPIIPWLLVKKYPNSWTKYINTPVIFTGTSNLPPALPINYIPAAVVCFVFNYVIRRRHFSWWNKYNYILSAGLDSGLAICTVFIFFVLQFPKNGTIGSHTVQKWWGNSVVNANYDGKKVPLRKVAKGETFGLQPGQW